MNDPVTNICHAADKQLFTLVEWAKRIPHFSDLTLEDQVILLRAGKGQQGFVSPGGDRERGPFGITPGDLRGSRWSPAPSRSCPSW